MKTEYCLTKIPEGLLGFSKIKTNETYDLEYWNFVCDKLNEENKRYEKYLECITSTREEMQKEFRL